MWQLLLFVSLASVSTVPVPQTKPSIPPKVGLGSTGRVDTNKPGDGSTKWKQTSGGVGGGFGGPPPCKCPEGRGWSPEELEGHRLRTNLTGGSKHCFCSFNNEHWTERWRPSVYGELCLCPSVNGWSLNELEMHNTVSNIKGTANDCFCSSFDQHTAQDLIPHGPVEANCTCPDHCGWTEKQLFEIESVTDITAMSNDCFCEDGYGYSIRRKVIFNDSHKEGCDYGNVSSVSTISSTGPNNKLMPLAINGTLKEFRLGSLLVKFAK